MARTSSARYAGVHRRSGGFTLIELMVVVLIIGLVATTVVLSVGVTGRDNELETEGERAYSLLNYVRDKAQLQTREFGLFCNDTVYEFVTFDPRRSVWRAVDEDDSLRQRKLPAGLKLRLVVEGREVVLKRVEDQAREDQLKDKDKKEKDRVPHVMLFSNGDLTPFALTLEREGEGRSITMASNDQGKIEEQPLKEAPK
jgi:general secretion pathway protein H